MHRLFFALILLGLTCGSYAAEVNNLYQAQLPIDSRDKQARDTLTPQLLHQVILKVVGNTALVNKTDLTSLLSKADQYVQQFEYLRTNVVTADLTQPDQLELKQRFDATAVNQALRGLGLPIWGKIRPDVLVWTAVKQAQQRYLLGLENTDSNLVQAMSKAANKRGLPVLFPLMDLQDQTQVSVDAVWKQDEDLIQAASLRYGADSILVAQVSINDDGANVQWQAVIGDEVTPWQSQGTLQGALDNGMGTLADKLASRYSQTVDMGEADKRLSLHISDVMGYGDFTRLMTYLRQLDYITDIHVIDLNEQKLALDIAFSGNLQFLQRSLAVGHMLAEDNSFNGNDAKQYRLLP